MNKPEQVSGPSAGGARRWYGSPLVMTVGALVLIGAGVGGGVLLSARSTPSPAPPAAMMAPPPGAASARPPLSPELEALRQEAEPESASTRTILAFARRALDEGQFAPAITAYKRVLAREPRNPEALTHLGLILAEAQHFDQALARIDEALQVDPKYPRAHWGRARILFQGKRDYAAAIPALEAVLALSPTGPDADQARAMLEEARRQVKQGSTATGSR